MLAVFAGLAQTNLLARKPGKLPPRTTSMRAQHV